MKTESKRGFALVELMVVILIVGILAAVAIPLMQGRIDKAKWSEANATAGMIRRAVRAYAGEMNVAAAQAFAGTNLNDSDIREALGFGPTDLEGNYFTTADYTLSSVDDFAVAVITVVGTKPNAPSGTYQLTADGNWEMVSQGGGGGGGGGKGKGGGSGEDEGKGGDSGGDKSEDGGKGYDRRQEER